MLPPLTLGNTLRYIISNNEIYISFEGLCDVISIKYGRKLIFNTLIPSNYVETPSDKYYTLTLYNQKNIYGFRDVTQKESYQVITLNSMALILRHVPSYLKSILDNIFRYASVDYSMCLMTHVGAIQAFKEPQKILFSTEDIQKIFPLYITNDKKHSFGEIFETFLNFLRPLHTDLKPFQETLDMLLDYQDYLILKGNR